MRSLFVWAFLISIGLGTGGALAADANNAKAVGEAAASPKVSSRSPEGQAMVKRAREITRQLRFKSRPPVTYYGPVFYPTTDPDRGGPGSSRERTPGTTATTPDEAIAKLTAERASLLSRLDLTSEDRSRIFR